MTMPKAVAVHSTSDSLRSPRWKDAASGIPKARIQTRTANGTTTAASSPRPVGPRAWAMIGPVTMPSA